MKTNWDYSNLADAYLKRPDYSEAAIKEMLTIMSLDKESNCCDVGAGVGHLTIVLSKYLQKIIAVEPNDAMRNNGISRTNNLKNVSWLEGTGEETRQPDDMFDLVSFGSSFNVCQRDLALKETKRILNHKGWFCCMFNHRDLDDPIQKEIESIIKTSIPEYGYGTRREDQSNTIINSNLFFDPKFLKGAIMHEQDIASCIEAWKSHATLERQAGDNFIKIINDIENYLISMNVEKINIPYNTKIWFAQLR